MGSDLVVRLRSDHRISLRRAAFARLFRRSDVWCPDTLSVQLTVLAIRPLDLQAAAEAYLARHGHPSAS